MNKLPPPRRSRWAAVGGGFTLIELLVVLVIIGAVALFVLPRLLDLNGWRVQAYADELRSQTLAMQRLALMQRRPVQASISPTGVVFSYAGGGATLLTMSCPAGSSPCIAEAGTRTATFNSGNEGRTVTSSGAALPITLGSGPLALRLEADTGLLRQAP